MKKKLLKYIFFGLMALALMGCGAGFWLWALARSQYEGPEAVRIYVPAGTSAQALGDTLRSNLGKDFGEKAAMMWEWQDVEPSRSEGSYVVEPGSSALHVARMLASGHQTPIKVTFNNIRTMPQLAERVCAKLEIAPDSFLLACDSVLGKKGYEPEQFIAAFLPDTYEFYWNAKAPAVVERLSGYKDKFWNEERLSKAKALGLDPVQVATLASIVEEETVKADEQPKVARLYLNRLGKGMLLQADPTVKFAIGDFGLRRILARHLQAESPYNTYKYAGLPPGPIRLASQRGIDAVLNAPAHTYLYMCAKEDFSGYHNFAASLADHQANARRYQAQLNKRGIK